MARLPTVLSTDDLPLAELCAARIDGELIAIDEAWAPVDEPDLPSLRASAVALRAPRTLVIERYSAAWVHGALPAPPAIAQFCVPRTSRIAVISSTRFVVREVVIADDDVVEFPRARCTSVVRTAFDLLREPGPENRLPEQIVAELCAARARLIDELTDRFTAAIRLPHRALALERLDRVRVGTALRAVSRSGVTADTVQLSVDGRHPSLTR